MRYAFIVPLILCVALSEVHAALALAPEPTPEQKGVIEFQKGVASPDKEARLKAIETYAATKPPKTSWPFFVRVASSDPEAEVRHTAFESLAKMPARDTSLAKLLISIFESQKPNELKERAFLEKLMAPSEFKADILATLADQVQRLRWPDDPKMMKGKTNSDHYEKMKEECKQKRDEFTAILTLLSDIGNCDVTEGSKETQARVKRWWDANQAKFQKADSEILAKYAKEDAEAAKAAKDAAMAAISGKPKDGAAKDPAATVK